MELGWGFWGRGWNVGREGAGRGGAGAGPHGRGGIGAVRGAEGSRAPTGRSRSWCLLGEVDLSIFSTWLPPPPLFPQAFPPLLTFSCYLDLKSCPLWLFANGSNLSLCFVSLTRLLCLYCGCGRSFLTLCDGSLHCDKIPGKFSLPVLCPGAQMSFV